ncbi:hypothetical protein [Brucella pecoris]|uniref:Uncharacterized protein n=1 Tax=Brucella pecoris TaxID=867683 RepID=A0AB34YZ40_9HYPH|nr:hypothetical protein [Brucella pecoris]
MTTRQTTNNGESRLERGKRVLAEINGEAGNNVIAALADMPLTLPVTCLNSLSVTFTAVPALICALAK